MKLSEFQTRIKMMVPNFNDSGLTDTQLTDLINDACNKVNLIAKVYKGYTDFNVVADQIVYTLSTSVPNFMGSEERGLYFLDTSSQWQKLYPKSISWIAQRFRDYLNASSIGLPQYYWLVDNELGFYPPASTSTTAGARLYHLQKATPMSNQDHYPFNGTTTELAYLIPLDDAIIAYCRWKLSPAFGKITDLDLREREYLAEVRKGMRQIKRRPDAIKDIYNYPAYRGR